MTETIATGDHHAVVLGTVLVQLGHGKRGGARVVCAVCALCVYVYVYALCVRARVCVCVWALIQGYIPAVS